MADIDKRLHYFNGQFLQDVDFKAEQDYHVERQRRHNRLLHTFGVAEGLTVAVPDGKTVTVSPGTAIDGQGHQIVLTQGDARSLPLAPFAGKKIVVVISYAEATSDPATVGGSGDTRFQERPNVQLVVDDTNAPPVDTFLRLAGMQVDGSGLLSGAIDLSARAAAGSRLGTDTSVQTLRLANATGDSKTWPVLTSKAANEADLAGTLAVTGDVKVGATGASVSAHLADKTNPHGTTAAQVGALASVAGVTSTTGNVGITPGGAIVVTPDATNRRVIISENHSTQTGNPHATLAAQLSDYDLGQRGINILSWTGSGTPPTSLGLSFAPRLVWITGQCIATFSNNVPVGGVISGFADLRSLVVPAAGGGPATSLRTGPATLTPAVSAIVPIIIPPPVLPPTFTQCAFGPQITRTAAGLVVSSASATTSNSVIAIATFTDQTVSPQLDVTATIKITGVSGFTLSLATSLTNASGSTQFKNFTMNLALFCMGLPTDTSSSGGGGAPPPGNI